MGKTSHKKDMAEIVTNFTIDVREETDDTEGNKKLSVESRLYENSDDETSVFYDDGSIYWGAENLMYLCTSPCVHSIVKKNEHSERVCQLCCTTKTPLWRRTNEYHTLCNACGIRVRTAIYKKRK